MYERHEHVKSWKCEKPNNRRGWLVDAFKVPFNILEYISFLTLVSMGRLGVCLLIHLLAAFIDVVAVRLYMLNVVACCRC